MPGSISSMRVPDGDTPLAAAGIIDNRGQRLTDFMGAGAGHLAHERQAGGMFQLLAFPFGLEISDVELLRTQTHQVSHARQTDQCPSQAKTDYSQPVPIGFQPLPQGAFAQVGVRSDFQIAKHRADRLVIDGNGPALSIAVGRHG